MSLRHLLERLRDKLCRLLRCRRGPEGETFGPPTITVEARPPQWIEAVPPGEGSVETFGAPTRTVRARPPEWHT